MKAVMGQLDRDAGSSSVADAEAMRSLLQALQVGTQSWLVCIRCVYPVPNTPFPTAQQAAAPAAAPAPIPAELAGVLKRISAAVDAQVRSIYEFFVSSLTLTFHAHSTICVLQASALTALTVKVDARSAGVSLGFPGGSAPCPEFTLADFGDSLSAILVRQAASKSGLHSDNEGAPGVLGVGSFGAVIEGAVYSGTVPVALKAITRGVICARDIIQHSTDPVCCSSHAGVEELCLLARRRKVFSARMRRGGPAVLAASPPQCRHGPRRTAGPRSRSAGHRHGTVHVLASRRSLCWTPGGQCSPS